MTLIPDHCQFLLFLANFIDRTFTLCYKANWFCSNLLKSPKRPPKSLPPGGQPDIVVAVSLRIEILIAIKGDSTDAQ